MSDLRIDHSPTAAADAVSPVRTAPTTTLVQGVVTDIGEAGAFSVVVGDRTLTGRTNEPVQPGALVVVKASADGAAVLVEMLRPRHSPTDRLAAIAAALQGAAGRQTSVPPPASVLGAVAAAATNAVVQGDAAPVAPPALAAALDVFVKAILGGRLGLGRGADGDADAHQATGAHELPASQRWLADLLTRRPAADQPDDVPSAGFNVGTMVEEVSVAVAREVEREQGRAAAQWLAEGRAELAVPIDVAGSPGWVRLRVGAFGASRQSSSPAAPAHVAILVELANLGPVHAVVSSTNGHVHADIATQDGEAAKRIRPWQSVLSDAVRAAGVTSWSCEVKADPRRVAREWPAWPLPALAEGSLVDIRA